MPIPIEDLIIAASIDPRGIKRGLDDGAGYLKDFGKGVQSELDRLSPRAKDTGITVANAILDGANSTFVRKRAILTEGLLNGTLTEAQFKAEGAKLATAFNTSLSEGIKRLRTDVTGGASFSALSTLTDAAKKEGIAAGANYGKGLSEGISSSVALVAGSVAAMFAASKVVSAGKDSLTDAARYQTLGVVMGVLGENTGHSMREMLGFEASIERTGISVIQTRNNIARMASAQLDLKRSGDLARVAQDAAVIANVNSSEAYERLIYGIVSGQTKVLRTMGIFVSFKSALDEYAKAHNRTSASLSEHERAEIRLNAVLEAGAARTGVYIASLGTAGKELKSTERYLENLRVKLGTVFLPEYTTAVHLYAEALKFLGENTSAVIGGLYGIAAALVVLVTAWKAESIIGGIAAVLANPVIAAGILATVAALGLLATIFGSDAANAALARQEVAEYAKTIQSLPNTALGRVVNNAAMQIAELRRQRLAVESAPLDNRDDGRGELKRLERLQEINAQINRIAANRQLAMNQITANARASMAPKPDDEGSDPEGAWKRHLATIKAVIDANRELDTERIASTEARKELLSSYVAINAEIGRATSLTSKHTAELLKLRREMGESAMLTAIMNAGGSGVRLTKGGAAALAGEKGDAVQTASMLLDRLRLMEQTGRGTGAAYDNVVEALRILDRFIGELNDKEGITNDRLRTQIALREALAAKNNVVMPQFKDPGIDAQVSAVQRAFTLAAGARTVGASNAKQLEDEANSARERAVTMMKNLIEQTGSLNDLSVSERQELERIVAMLDKMGIKTKETVSTWAEVRTAIEGVLDAAGGFAKIPQALRDGVTSALHLVDVLKQAQALRAAGTAISVGTILGGVGALLGVVGSVMSLLHQDNEKELEAQRENVSRLKQNSEKLADFTLAMRADSQTGSLDLMHSVQVLLESVTGQLPGGSYDGGSFSYDDIVAAMKKAGFDIGTTAEGMAESLRQFLTYLAASTEALRKFSDSLSDQTALSDLRNRVYGKTETADALTSTIALLNQFAPRLGAAFTGLDATTEEGRAKIKSALIALYEMLAANTLTAEDFGKLTGSKDLATLIGSIADSLNAMGKATDKVTSSLLNVPSGYKVALARFNATAPLLSDTLSGASSSSSSTFSTVTSKNVTNLQSSMQTGGSITIAGDILVDARALSADEIFAAVLKAAQRAAATQFNDTTKWSQVQSAP